MALQDTNLFLESAPLPATFSGGPDELRQEIVKRLRIKSTTNITFVTSSDSEPTSNVGLWLKGGKQLYTYSETIKRYVPLDISDSDSPEIQISESTPASSDPAVWLRTSGNNPVGWYFWNGTLWTPGMNIVQAGPTASRPASPFDLQQYYDSDISCLIWWERGEWKTVTGVPGDVKFVATPLLSDALTQNPGWELFGASQQSFRGRTISMATNDSEQTLTVGAGIAQRTARETFGETDGVQINPASPVPYPPTIALWCLVKV